MRGMRFIVGMSLSLSCMFTVSIFSFALCIVFTQLAPRFLLEETALCVAVYLVCPWEEGSSGASYVIILVHQASLLILVRINIYSLGVILDIVGLIFAFPSFI